MAERKATNKYYPPDWDPSKGSINKYRGEHPLRERAKKLDQGILIIRFELPFNIWCEGCNQHIGMGVRYNAEKKKIGKYHSTPIWSFRMRCHLCSNWMEIHTDPKNTDYVVVSGARKKVETWEAEDAGVLKLNDEDENEKLQSNAFLKLEHEQNDIAAAKASKSLLTQIQQINDKNWEDPFSVSQRLRKRLREEKKVVKEELQEAISLSEKMSLSIDLLPKSESDELEAKKLRFQSLDISSTSILQDKRIQLELSSVFSATNPSSSSSSFSSPSPQAKANMNSSKSEKNEQNNNSLSKSEHNKISHLSLAQKNLHAIALKKGIRNDPFAIQINASHSTVPSTLKSQPSSGLPTKLGGVVLIKRKSEDKVKKISSSSDSSLLLQLEDKTNVVQQSSGSNELRENAPIIKETKSSQALGMLAAYGSDSDE